MFYINTYKGNNKDSVLLGEITELVKDESRSPPGRLSQIERCVASYWKKVLVRKVLDFRTEAGAQSSFHFDDKMSLDKLVIGCWETRIELNNYLNSVQEAPRVYCRYTW